MWSVLATGPILLSIKHIKVIRPKKKKLEKKAYKG